MANNWTTPCEWENEGTAPSDSLKKKGFFAGYKPPAAIFNYFLNKTSKCIKELQTALDTTDKKTKPISEGGTGATDRVNAFKNLSYLGDEPIKGTANDTVANWVALGSGIAYYSHLDMLIGQPTQHGTVINITNGVGDLTQIWQTRPSGLVFVRGGNTGGWANEGKWSKMATDEALSSHANNKANPHAVTKSQVGLGNVDNTSDANKPVSTAQATAINNAKSVGTSAQTSIDNHKNDKANPHNVTKSQVGLGNVDNTSDANKPVSTAQATSIADAKKAGTDAQTNLNSHTGNKSNPHAVTKAQVGLGNVDNTSDSNKPVSTAQATAIADAKKAGADAQTNLTAHANNKSNPHGVTKSQVGLGNVDNTADADKTVKNAMFFKDHNMRADDQFLYVNNNTVTHQTNSVWYLKIKLSRQYSNHSSPIRLEGDYDNLKSVVYLNLEGIANQWSVKISDYNETNIIGIRVATGVETYIYLKMRAPTNGTGNCAIHTDFVIKEMATYDGTGETFTTLKKGFYTTMPITCFNKVQGLNSVIEATSSDGVNYSATLEGLSSLYNGLTLTIVPNKTSVQKDITFNINGLGARNIKLTYPTKTGDSGVAPTNNDWLTADAPITIRYHQKANVWKADLQRQNAGDLVGVVPYANGGTGANSLEGAKTNLGIAELESQIDAFLNVFGDISDFIVAQGNSGIWTYRKWWSGIAECWGTELLYPPEAFDADSTFVFYGKNFPFTFVEAPIFLIQDNANYSYRTAKPNSVYEDTFSISVTTATGVTTNTPIRVQYSVKGKWK